MGHIANAKNSLVPLIDRINKYPIGLVDNEKLRQILAILFTEEEAYVASKFPLEEATAEELSKLTGKSNDVLIPILENMADKGIIMDMPYGDTTYYLLMPGLIGFFEFTFMKNRTDLPMDELAKLMSEYLYDDPKNGQAGEFFGSKTPLTKAMVTDDQIPVSSTITDTHTAKKIINESDFGAVTMCYCRHKKEHEGKTCKKNMPTENTCISIGTGARFLVRRGFARECTKEELLAIIDMADEHNLTHITDNIRYKPSFICNCCGCCCEIMHGVQMGYYEGVGKTDFIATIDPVKCDYCGDCFTACNVKAIGLAKNGVKLKGKDRYSAVRDNICLGCAACITSCKNDAISMIARENSTQPPIPNKKRDLFAQILREKGRLTPFVISRAKKTVKKWVRMGR